MFLECSSPLHLLILFFWAEKEVWAEKAQQGNEKLFFVIFFFILAIININSTSFYLTKLMTSVLHS